LTELDLWEPARLEEGLVLAVVVECLVGDSRLGYGRGFFGWRWTNWPNLTPEEETASLEQEKKWLESQLETINQRLEKNKSS